MGTEHHYIPPEYREKSAWTFEHIKMVENGDLWIFHTSSEPQPRSGKVGQYQVFVDYAKTGKTYAFMESWSSAQTNRDDYKRAMELLDITR